MKTHARLAGKRKSNDLAEERKRKAVADRIELIHEAIIKGREYLESGAHAEWSGFRAWFHRKKKDGKELPPHRDWVRNVFLRDMEKALVRAEKVLEKLRCTEQ